MRAGSGWCVGPGNLQAKQARSRGSADGLNRMDQSTQCTALLGSVNFVQLASHNRLFGRLEGVESISSIPGDANHLARVLEPA